MLKKLILLAVFLTKTLSACAECEDQQVKEFNLRGLSDIKLLIKKCSLNDTSGNVTINVIKNNKTSQVLHSTFDSDSYVLDVNPDFIIDSSGGPDLAVATGKGRAGDGMHYWKIDKKNLQYTDLGEAPTLIHDKDGNLFSLESSTGEFRSIRYNYNYGSSGMKIVSAIGFSQNGPPEKYEITHLKPNPKSLEDKWESLDKITVPADIAEKCMDGTGACP
jgi:hypothetical protein